MTFQTRVQSRKVGSSSILVEEVARRIRPVVEDNRLAEAVDGHTLVAVEAGHNPAAVADRIRTVAEVVRSPAAEADIPLVVVRSRLAHRTVLTAEPHIVLAEAHRIPDRLADGYLSHLWYHRRSRWRRGGV